MTDYSGVAVIRRVRSIGNIVAASAMRRTPVTGQRRRRRRTRSVPTIHFSAYAWGLAVTAGCTVAVYPIGTHVDLINIVMVYMLGSALAGLWLGREPSALTALANVLAFDYFFVPPRFSFAVYDVSYLITFSAMLLVSLVITSLVVAIRAQMAAAKARERHTAALFAVAGDLSAARDGRSMGEITARRLAEELGCRTAVFLCDERRQLGAIPIAVSDMASLSDASFVAVPSLVAAAQNAALVGQQYSDDAGLYVPLANAHRTAGVLVVSLRRGGSLPPEQRRLVNGVAGQLASALERVRLAHIAEEARVVAEKVAMRNTLLASISHDLRTPLSAIASAGSMVARGHFTLDAHRRATLGGLIEEKARDMSDLLSNVLDLVKLESGAEVLSRDWHMLGDIVGLAIQRNEARLSGWDVSTDIPDDLPMVSLDATLFVQLLSNLLENATKYTPPGTRIGISASFSELGMRIVVQDNGPGWGAMDPERLFEKFSRGHTESATGGVGLGLTICRAIARLHGGEIRASSSSSEGGARFEIEVPVPMEDALLEAAAAEA